MTNHRKTSPQRLEPVKTVMGEQRLFFSLKFSLGQQQQLLPYQKHALAISTDARPTDEDNLHLTLFFLGQTNPTQQQQLLIGASQITVPAFTLTFDYLAYFARPKILYLAPSVIPQPLLHLQHQLATLCKLAGFSDLHSQYRPHITLARNANCLPGFYQSVSPIVMQIKQFALYQSLQQQGRLRYLPLTLFELD